MYKRILCTIISFTMFLISGIPIVKAANGDNISLQNNELKVYINKSNLLFSDAKPYISESGRTMIPIRAVSEAFGAKVDWNAELGLVTITKEDIELKFIVGYVKDVLTVRSLSRNRVKEILMDSPPVIKQDRTYVPLRVISEAFGYKADWNPQEQRVDINSEEITEVFIKNPALHENLYVIENEMPLYKVPETALSGMKEVLTLSEELSNKAKSYLEDFGIGNIDYRNITVEQSVYGTSYEAYKYNESFKNAQIYYNYMKDQFELKVDMFDYATKNSIVREAEFITSPANVKFTGNDDTGYYEGYVTGKLRFKYHSPTSNEYLNQFNREVELNKWYETTAIIKYKYNRFLVQWDIDLIILEEEWEYISNG